MSARRATGWFRRRPKRDPLDWCDHAVSWVACPDCGQEIPVTFGPLELVLDDNGEQVARVDIQTDDLWAHAWTHEDLR